MTVHAVMWVVKASLMDWGQLYLMQIQGLDKVNAGECGYYAMQVTWI